MNVLGRHEGLHADPSPYERRRAQALATDGRVLDASTTRYSTERQVRLCLPNICGFSPLAREMPQEVPGSPGPHKGAAPVCDPDFPSPNIRHIGGRISQRALLVRWRLAQAQVIPRLLPAREIGYARATQRTSYPPVPRIRKLEIRNFRAIKSLDWFPSSGINCLIGPGDSGKSSVLEAIDICLGARRSFAFTDADFHCIDHKNAILIRVTLGDLPQELKSIEAYSEYLRGFLAPEQLVDEPKKGYETVLTIQLTVAADMEPQWQLYSDRTAGSTATRMVAWKSRVALSPSKIGAYASSNLAWSRGSVLNRLSEERPEVGAELFAAARLAREEFGDAAEKYLAQALGTVTSTATNLGISVGEKARALLDAHSASFGDGAISLHDDGGVPLRNLGAGSSRLLIAGLHRAAARATSLVLSDEVEVGLEPHRIVLLLKSLGAKERQPPLQCFLTTHSPVVVRELSSSQLYVIRRRPAAHEIRHAATVENIQATLRWEPEAFLAKSVVVCEGATEKGLVRGLNRFWASRGALPLEAYGLACVNVNGGHPEQAVQRAQALGALGYRSAVLIDRDKDSIDAIAAAFIAEGGALFRWGKGHAVENAIFAGLPAAGVAAAVEKACELNGESLVDDNIKSKSEGRASLASIRKEGVGKAYSQQSRACLGAAAKDCGWFKEEWRMDELACDVVGPHLAESAEALKTVVTAFDAWARHRVAA